MGSFKGYGRPEQPSRRRSRKTPRRNGLPRIEFLEDRRLLSGNGTTDRFPRRCGRRQAPNLFDAQNGPMANLGVALVRRLQGVRAERRPAPRSSRASSRSIQFRTGWWGLRSRAWGVISTSS